MTLPVVRTVLGDVPAEELYGFDAHDHLFLDAGPAPGRDTLLLTSADEAKSELAAYRDAGGGTVVCATPTGLGRRPDVLAAISAATGVAVLATGGFHKASYYPAMHWANTYPLDTVARLIYSEAAEGIDRYDYAGPVVERTQVRPGVLKAGGDFHRLAGREREWHRIVAAVGTETGLPMMLHVEHGACPHLQLDVAEKAGLAPERILVCHLDRNVDTRLHHSVARRGAFLVYDGLYRERYRPQSAVIDLIADLAADGHLDKILIGGDLADRRYRRAAGAPGIAGIYTHLAQAIRDQLGDETAHRILTVNPRAAFAVYPPRPGASPLQPKEIDAYGP